MQVNASLLGSLSPAHLLHSFGAVGVLAILFLELGVLLAFFLPGDSLLFVAGYATVTSNSLHFTIPLGWLLLASVTGALAGGQLGYEVGRRAGPTLHERPDSRFFKRDYVLRADGFLTRFGSAKAVVISRFLPVLRTFVPPLVGIAGMSRRSYVAWNIISGVGWTVPIILLGHALGHVDFIRKYVEGLAVVIVVISVAPLVVHYLRQRKASPR